MNDHILLGLINIGVAVVMIIVSIPLIRGKVKMNKFYGMRIPKAFESEDNWYKINAYGGRCFLKWGIVLAAVGGAIFFLPLNTAEPPNGLLIHVLALAPVLVLLPCIIQILVYARKVS